MQKVIFVDHSGNWSEKNDDFLSKKSFGNDLKRLSENHEIHRCTKLEQIIAPRLDI